MASFAHDSIPLKKADLIAHATEALGRENALQWLQTPNAAIDDRMPLDVIFEGQPENLQLLDELLAAFEHGVFV